MVRLVRDPRQWGMGREYELADVLECQGRARDAGRLLYAAWHALRAEGSHFGITAWDTLRTLQQEHDLGDADVATETHFDELVASLFREDTLPPGQA